MDLRFVVKRISEDNLLKPKAFDFLSSLFIPVNEIPMKSSTRRGGPSDAVITRFLGHGDINSILEGER